MAAAIAHARKLAGAGFDVWAVKKNDEIVWKADD